MTSELLLSRTYDRVLDWPIESRIPNDERASTNAINQSTCMHHRTAHHATIMRSAAALRRALHPDRRWSTLARALACVFCLLLVCQQYQEKQWRQEQQRLPKTLAAAMAIALDH